MIDITPTTFPIIVLANFRTGSSALAIHLARKYDLVCYSEPFHNENLGLFDEHKINFISTSINGNNRFVVKFMPSQISGFNNYEQMLNQPGFKIRLNRTNKIEQIVSLYVAEKRDKFFKLHDEEKEKYTLKIDKNFLYRMSNVILRNDFLLRTLPYSYDLDLTYEDLGFIENTDHVLSDQPENIEEIREEVRRILQLKWEYIEKNLNKKRERDCSLPLS